MENFCFGHKVVYTKKCAEIKFWAFCLFETHKGFLSFFLWKLIED